MTAPTPDSFDSQDGRTYSGPVTAATPGQAERDEPESLGFEPSLTVPARRDIGGRPLQPGVNVDKVDITAGLKQARAFGYATTTAGHMVIDYALRRHARGEEDGAQRTALRYGVDLTSWYAILAAALAAAS